MGSYMSKRRKSGLSILDVASELNIPYNKYLEIERGEVKMPKNLIDKFNELINRGKNINQLNRTQKEIEINNWFNDMTTKIDDKGTYKLNELMKEFNIDKQSDLAKLLGITPSYLCSALNKTPNACNQKIRNRLYDFFHNELNIQPIKKKEINKPINLDCTVTDKDELLKWWENFDFKNFMETNKIKQHYIAEEIGMANSAISRFYTTNATPRATNIAKIKSFVENYKKDDMKELKEQMPELPTEEEPLITTHAAIKGLYNIAKQIKKDDSAVEVIKSKIDSYLNNLEGLEYEIVKLNEQLNERKKEMQSLTIKKDALVEILNDLESGE